jgi:hypothetical protein
MIGLVVDNILVGQHEGKEILGRLKCREEINIKFLFILKR